MQTTIAGIFALLFSLCAMGETVSMREIALSVPVGSTIDVRLGGHQKPNKLRGQMGLLDNSAFNLVVEGSGEARSISFDQVKSLHVVGGQPAQPNGMGSTPQETAHAIPKGSLVETRFLEKRSPRSFRGRIGDIHDQDLEIQVFEAGAIRPKTVSFREIESLKPVDSLWADSKAAKVGRSIGIGASLILTGALVIAGVLGIMAATGHLGG
jgi:hypothetical protein